MAVKRPNAARLGAANGRMMVREFRAAVNGDAHPPAPRIDVKFPILGFLMEAEMTGYDLKRRFQDPIGFFYRVSDGSLYPALKKLARDGLVRMRAERRGKRARKVYAITPRGREHFLRLLSEPSAPLFVHDEAQVKVYFGQYDPRVALEHLRRMRRTDLESAADLQRLLVDMERKRETPFRKLMVELGLAITTAKAEAAARLEARLAREIAEREPRAAARSRQLRLAVGAGNR
jgi:DNA-binding PadR family transcriptional regulator